MTMKRTSLISVAVAFAGVAQAPGEAFARNRMYNPAVGRFMQRDPAGTMMVPQSPMARNMSEAMYTQRDPTQQYADGMNLCRYVRSNPARWRDPSGLKVVAPCREPCAWHAIPIDYGVTAGQTMDPDTAKLALKIAAILEFFGGVAKSSDDVIGTLVETLGSGGAVSPGGNPDTTAKVAEVIRRIIKEQRAFLWVQAWCGRCESDKDSPTGCAWHYSEHHPKPWHLATLSFDTGDKPKEWFYLNKNIVRTVASMGGMVQLQTLKKSDVEDLREAMHWEVWFKAEEICSKGAK